MSTKQIQDLQTGEIISLIPVTFWYDGTTQMTNQLCDEIIYFKDPDNPNSNLFYKRYIEHHINVKWFGAKGDVNTDDTVSIQKAFDYLIDLRKYRHILNPSYNLLCFIPDGKYKISSTLIFPTSCNLKGESTNGTQLFTTSKDISILFPSEKGDVLNNHHHRDSSDPYTNVSEEFTSISNLTLAGPNYNINPYIEKDTLGTNNSGILIKSTTKINLDNIYIEGFETSGIYCHNSYYININNCCLYNNQIGLLADGTCTTIYISNTNIRINSVGIIMTDSYGCNIVNSVIESNNANYLRTIDINRSPYNSRDIGVILKNCQNINFSECYFENNLVTIILDESKSNNFTGCFFCPDNGPFEAAQMQTYLLWFYGNNSSYNKFTNNFFDTSNLQLFNYCKFFTQYKNTSKGNIFELSAKNHLDLFIEKNQDEFSDFIINDLKSNAPKLICTGANEQFINTEKRYIIDKTFGTSSERPNTNLYNGQYYFDSTLEKPIYWQGTKWVKADGTDV